MAAQGAEIFTSGFRLTRRRSRPPPTTSRASSPARLCTTPCTPPRRPPRRRLRLRAQRPHPPVPPDAQDQRPLLLHLLRQEGRACRQPGLLVPAEHEGNQERRG
ncbi:unnamed protein product [Urochloa humidicola]